MPLFRVARLRTDALRLPIGTPAGAYVKGGKTSDGCVVTSNWNASCSGWQDTDALKLHMGTPAGASAQGGKTYDGCVVTSNWNASWFPCSLWQHLCR